MGMKYRFALDTASEKNAQNDVVDLDTLIEMCDTMSQGFGIVSMLERIGKNVKTQHRITKIVIEEVND